MKTYLHAQMNALGDPTRRAILERLLEGPAAVGKLASEFPVSRPAISQHLKILKTAQLVVYRPVGNRRLYELDRAGIEALHAYFDRFWTDAVAAFKHNAERRAIEGQNRQGEVLTVTTRATDAPVRKTISVNATVEHAFEVFTEGFDTWWPRSHHIGKQPMEKAIVEPRLGGRCYSHCVDASECDWGRILVWDPPRRLVIGWQITPEWQHEPDLARCSEVDVRFTAQPDGSTRVDLEHRHFDRHGPGGDSIRTAVDSRNGWGDLLQLYARAVERH